VPQQLIAVQDYMPLRVVRLTLNEWYFNAPPRPISIQDYLGTIELSKRSKCETNGDAIESRSLSGKGLRSRLKVVQILALGNVPENMALLPIGFSRTPLDALYAASSQDFRLFHRPASA
jgi:hypothetical protein